MTISIIVPFAGHTADLIPDLVQATQGAELVIVDNASSPETAQALRDVTTVYIRNEENVGFAAGNNQGYARAAGDIIVFLNSDVAGDARFLRAVAADVKPGALYGPSMQQQLVAGRWLPYIEGWCIAATRETWDKLVLPVVGVMGPWDHISYPGPYWEDNDLCLRALAAGVMLIQTAWPIQHKGGKTAGPLTQHAASIEQNRATFAARAAAFLRRSGAPDLSPMRRRYFAELGTPSDIQHHLPLLYSLAHGTVVELGTRSGVSTAALLAGVEAHGGHVWSIDTDARSAAVAAGHPHWTFLQADSRNPELLAHIGGAVDVLLIDTEHTVTQASAELALWGPHMAPGGTILMHDPETFPGVRRAAADYAAAQGWDVTFVLPNNGMAILKVPDPGVSDEGAAWASEAQP